MGNVYLGIVQNVLPSMEAAFVEIGRGRNGALRRQSIGMQRWVPQIEALKPGDYVVVQVSKDPVGHKARG